MQELSARFRASGLRLLVSVPADEPEYDFAKLASLADGLILMTYDEHFERGEPGPLAGQGWYEALLDRHFKGVDPAKLIVGVGSYGYDWTGPGRAREISVQEAWELLESSRASLRFDAASLNPTFTYVDDTGGQQHQVWYLDGATAYNQIGAALSMKPGGLSAVPPRHRGSEPVGGVRPRPQCRCACSRSGAASQFRIRRALQGQGRSLARHRDAGARCAQDHRRWRAQPDHRTGNRRLPQLDDRHPLGRHERQDHQSDLRRRARSQVHARDPGYPGPEGREGDVLHRRLCRRHESRPASAHLSRGSRHRQSHLHAPQPERLLARALAAGAQRHAASDRVDRRRAHQAFPSALRRRSGAADHRWRRRAAGGDPARLSHHRHADRSQGLAAPTLSPDRRQDGRGRGQGRRQCRPAARCGRQPHRDHRGAAADHRSAARRGLPFRHQPRADRPVA